MKTVNSRLWKPFQAPAFNQHLKLGEMVVLFYIITPHELPGIFPRYPQISPLLVSRAPWTGARNAASLGFCVKGGWKIWRPWCHQLLCFLDPWENGVFSLAKSSLIFGPFGCRINSLRLLLKLGDSPPKWWSATEMVPSPMINRSWVNKNQGLALEGI